MATTKLETPATNAADEYTIEFIRDYFVKDGTGTIHRKGEKKTFTKASCEHFVKRDAARYVGNKPPEVKEVEDFNPAKMVAQEKALSAQQ